MASPQLSIKRNDTVVVIAGKEKGKRGKVLVVLPARQRLIVERVNFVKRHQRPTQKVRQGGIIEREGSLHVSNVMLVCGKCDRPTRPAVQVLADGRRVRICRRCRETLDRG
jgi:large subunit ribosomal protein L24